MLKTCSIKLNKDGSIVRARAPECAGISSAAVLKMLAHLEQSGFQYHSLMIVRNGVVAAECYRYPVTRTCAHTMYSVSKTFTGTAVGFAVSEGLISLDTRVADILPEYRKKKEKNGYIDKMTVRHLLTMTSGKLPSPLLNKTQDDWLSHLFDAKWVSEPGTKFDYVNENMYTLCAILHRVTGMSVVDFLMPRLFEPLGIERPVWETDGHGVEAGGWGLFLKTEDIAKVMLCYHNGGRWGDKQVIDEEWVKQATSNQHGDNPGVRERGYGYGIWIKDENEYYAGGMFCQMSYIFEKEDCAAVITSCSPTDTPYYEALEILRNEGFIQPDANATADEEFIKSISERKIDFIPKSAIRSKLEKSISGRTVHFKKDKILNAVGFPTGVLHLAAVYMSKYRAGNIDDVRFDFYGEDMRFSWREGNERNSVKCGMNGEYINSRIVLANTPYTAASAAFWQDERTLNVWIRPIESLCCRKLKFTFESGGTVKMEPASSPDVSDIVASVDGAIHSMFGEKLSFLADKTLAEIKKLTQPVQKGKFRD
ncbi:MAG: serine hydrolase [Clostridiales bacterium]|nr:serine hydrolase [Clostridiales bacterium]